MMKRKKERKKERKNRKYREREIERGGVFSEIVDVIDQGFVRGVQTLNESVCISHRANTNGKAMNQTILLPSMGE